MLDRLGGFKSPSSSFSSTVVNFAALISCLAWMGANGELPALEMGMLGLGLV